MYKIRLFLTFVFIILTASFVSAHDLNKGHDSCFDDGCPPGHGFDECPDGSGNICGPDGIPNSGDECPFSDPECGVSLVDGCDVRQSTVLSGGGLLPSGIDICASGITLDCSGAALVGSGSEVGIYSYTHGGVTVTNCEVQDYRDGIYLSYSSDNSIVSNEIHSNAMHGIVTWEGSQNFITGNRVENNLVGISLQSNSNSNAIENNLILNNGYGIQLWTSSNNNIVVNNDILNNNDRGISFQYSSNNNIIIGNNISNNLLGAVFEGGSSANEFKSNEFCPSSTDVDFTGEIASNFGSDNKCDKPGAWNDTGAVGCTFKCSALELELEIETDVRSFISVDTLKFKAKVIGGEEHNGEVDWIVLDGGYNSGTGEPSGLQDSETFSFKPNPPSGYGWMQPQRPGPLTYKVTASVEINGQLLKDEIIVSQDETDVIRQMYVDHIIKIPPHNVFDGTVIPVQPELVNDFNLLQEAYTNWVHRTNPNAGTVLPIISGYRNPKQHQTSGETKVMTSVHQYGFAYDLSPIPSGGGNPNTPADDRDWIIRYWTITLGHTHASGTGEAHQYGKNAVHIAAISYNAIPYPTP